MNILGVFITRCKFLNPFIQTLKLIGEVAVGQQVFAEDFLIYISKLYLPEPLQMSLCPMIVSRETAVMPEAERKDLLLDLFQSSRIRMYSFVSSSFAVGT